MPHRASVSPRLGTPIDWTQPLSRGLVAAYPLSEGAGLTLNDATGLNAVGATGAAVWTPSQYGNGLTYPGGSTVNSPLGFLKALDNVPAVSFTCWLLCRALPFANFAGVLGRGSNSTRTGWVFGNSGASTLTVNWGCVGGTSSTVTGNLTAGLLTHLTVTYDSASGGATTAYLDATVSGTPGVVNGNTSGTDATTLLGQIAGFGTWDGLIALPKFWANRCLTPAEVAYDRARPYSPWQVRSAKRYFPGLSAAVSAYAPRPWVSFPETVPSQYEE